MPAAAGVVIVIFAVPEAPPSLMTTELAVEPQVTTMPLTRVAPSLIAVANNVTSNVFGSANTIPSLTFDAQGVISTASNTAIQINTADIVNGAVTAAKLAAGAALSNGLFSFTSSAITVIPDAPASVTPYKILGQIQTTANAATNVYVVPASTSTVVSTVTICNQSANNVLVDVTARFGSTALGNQHYLVYQYPLSAADTLVLEPRLTMNATSVLAANVTGANAASNVSVNAFGIEVK